MTLGISLVRRCLLALVVVCPLISASAAENASRLAAVETITADEAHAHVAFLADDTLEGREAGSRGGRAAAIYIVQQIKKCGVPGGGAKGSYYQPFGAGYSNILVLLEGSDPELKKQVIVAGAHFDHVGYGTARNSFGPIGLIHNGADDNASGVAGLLEVLKAFTALPERPKRSVLFAFWDGEEKGLLGSYHWIKNPTVPLEQVPIMLNVDMIGRLRNSRVEVVGSRTAPGLRRLLSQQNDRLDLMLDFTWEMKENSDHFPFYNRQVPVVMLHTGLHADYHRPTDDVEKINNDGLKLVARLMFNALDELADGPGLGGFRNASRGESPYKQQQVEQPLPALPGRLGVWWDERASQAGQVVVTQVVSGSSAAKAGLHVGDHITKFARHEVKSILQFRQLVLSARNPVDMEIERTSEKEPLDLTVQLVGDPTRLGITWRVDDAEPGCVILNRVVVGSPADVGGLKAQDRIYQVAGQDFVSGEDFRRLANATTGPLELLVETRGRTRTVTLHPVDEE